MITKRNAKLEFLESLKKGNKIHIKKSHEWHFTDYCGGKVTSECIQKGKNSSDSKIRKQAIFAENAKKWKHKNGGILMYLPGGEVSSKSSKEKSKDENKNPKDLSGLYYGISTLTLTGANFTDAYELARQLIDKRKIEEYNNWIDKINASGGEAEHKNIQSNNNMQNLVNRMNGVNQFVQGLNQQNKSNLLNQQNKSNLLNKYSTHPNYPGYTLNQNGDKLLFSDNTGKVIKDLLDVPLDEKGYIDLWNNSGLLPINTLPTLKTPIVELPLKVEEQVFKFGGKIKNFRLFGLSLLKYRTI